MQTNTLYASPYFDVYTDNCRTREFMHCHISVYLEATADQTISCTATFHYICRQLQNKRIWGMPYFIVFTENRRTNEDMQSHISVYLQTTADQLNIRSANCILFTDNRKPTQYMHCHISLYFHTIADKHNICTAIFHCVYIHLQNKWIYTLPNFIAFADNGRQNDYMHLHIRFYLKINADQPIIRTNPFHSIYRQMQTNIIYAIPYFFIFTANCRQLVTCNATFRLLTDNCRPTHLVHCQISLYFQETADQQNIWTAHFNIFTDNFRPN